MGGALVHRMGSILEEGTDEGITGRIRVDWVLQGENGLQNTLVITYAIDQLVGRGWTQWRIH